MNFFNPDRCCCNSVLVERGAYIIAIVGIVGSAIALLAGIVTVSYAHMVGGIIGILRFGSIIYAQKKRNPSFYLMFITLNGFEILFIGMYVLIWSVVLFMAPKASGMEVKVAIAGFAIVGILDVWFQSVVYRAYKDMKLINYLEYLQNNFD